ncbi:STAS domain-containing protein [Paenibacillus xanthanilyticus]|uniref:Anti-sigma factor antagonist n=1 Tax=Paenibacillus xanthanilyticus TaxID=1783531 RepID=A0ABV8JW62_9BACL
MEMSLQGDQLTIHLQGKIYVEQATTLREAVFEHLNGPCNSVIIDFKHVDFIDSSGLGVVVAIHKRLVSKHGRLTNKNIHGSVKKLFEMTRLDKVLNIE